jgi:hypothetical protein
LHARATLQIALHIKYQRIIQKLICNKSESFIAFTWILRVKFVFTESCSKNDSSDIISLSDVPTVDARVQFSGYCCLSPEFRFKLKSSVKQQF